ncbi:uncharacterized protein DNG_09174 [Cephalotrichum gorgonifer]|uniref:6-phosphogluconate dehydrogenase NADP-binding domain-containing protein n=1 Tax=Cephalotrichum gorgonifer TaxID=2041049 RepID=A0AAE8N6T3_9PEZI|nr:uncharacterized protein DNG_09174 [Cephalotrichum gorgonifer]
MTAVTYISVGNIGLGIVKALLKAGTKVTVWNRREDRAPVKEAINAGAVLEKDVKRAVANSPIIIVCTLNYATLKEIFADLPDGGLNGKVVVNFTSGTPGQAVEMDGWTRGNGVAGYFDGAILVPPAFIGAQDTPNNIFLLSGETEDYYLSLSPVLASIGRGAYLGPDVSTASRLDLAGITAMYGMFSGGILGMSLLKKASDGKPIAPTVKAAVVPMVQSLATSLERMAELWDKGDFETNDGHSLGMQVTGLGTLRTAYEEAGIEFGLCAPWVQLMKEAAEKNGADAGTISTGPLLFK